MRLLRSSSMAAPYLRNAKGLGFLRQAQPEFIFYAKYYNGSVEPFRTTVLNPSPESSITTPLTGKRIVETAAEMARHFIFNAPVDSSRFRDDSPKTFHPNNRTYITEVTLDLHQEHWYEKFPVQGKKVLDESYDLTLYMPEGKVSI